MTAPSLAIVGGGLAGLAAALAAGRRGLRVELFERANRLGGRAGAIVEPNTGTLIDRCQHVAMGCCPTLGDFLRQAEIDDYFTRQSTLHLMAPDGAQYELAPSRWLPAPLHLLPGLMSLKYLSLAERWRILKTLRRLVNEADMPRGKATDPAPNGTIGKWLQCQGQSQCAIELFWSVVLQSALSETVEHISLSAARQVFFEGFLASRKAAELLLPQSPLGQILDERLGRRLTAENVVIHRGMPIRRVEGDSDRANALLMADGSKRQFDLFVVAVPWHEAPSLFDRQLIEAMPALEAAGRLEPASITAVHLWFDRPIIQLPNAILIGRLSQWVFCNNPVTAASHNASQDNAQQQQHCQVVISASHRLPERTPTELVAEVCRELAERWPGGRLLHSRVITQPAAIFSPAPGTDQFRPSQQTPIRNLALAGDWTATGWPATMESAVRSGYRAVETLLNNYPA